MSGSPPGLVNAWIGLGANLGDTRQALTAAVAELQALPGTELLALSSAWCSAPVDAQGPDFLNAVALMGTQLEPLALLDALQAIEHRQGRERPHRNAPRTLDLDLLLYGEHRLDSDRLTLPHPRLHQRAFVLAPLAEIDPGLVIPGHGAVPTLLAACADQRCERAGSLAP